jgi:hypothetical protein
MTRLAALIATALAMTLVPAAVVEASPAGGAVGEASAKKPKKHKPKKRAPKRRKAEKAKSLWYRVSVEGHGRYRAEDPNESTGAHTWGVTTGFKVKSRTAVIIRREIGLADPRRESKRGWQYNTSAGLSGRATAFSRTATIEATEYCTRETSTDSPIAYAMLDGGVSLLAGPDYRDISFGLDYGLDKGLVQHEESGRECRDSGGNLYYKREPKSEQGPGAWGGILCDKTSPNDPNTVRTVSGEVNWGGAFTFTVSCRQDASSGGVTNVSSLDYSVTFTPCPGSGRRVKRC